MPDYVLLSTFDREGISQIIASELKRVINDTQCILFIASDPNGHEKTDKYAELLFRLFQESGIAFEKYSVLDSRKPDCGYVNAVENAPCIFLCGGTTLAQHDFLMQNDLANPIKNHKGVVIGMSAGAINMAFHSVIANPAHPPVRTFEGLGLVNITVIPHFNMVDIQYLSKEIFPLTVNKTIYGLCDDAIIAVYDSEIRHAGTVYKISKGCIKLLTENDCIYARRN